MRRLLCTLLAAGSLVSEAAQINIEPFDAGENGWVPLDGAAFMGWVSGEMGAYYDGGLSGPFPATLSASNAASSGRFVGNWITSRIDVIGFDLRADQTQQPTIELELRRGSDFVRKGITNISTNTQRFAASVESLAAGGWGGNLANEAAFTAMKTNIQTVKISLLPNANGVQYYYIDNIFLSRAFQWDGGVAGTGTLWMASTNWYDNGIPGSNSRVVFASTGSAQVVGIDSSTATGNLIQVGQMFCSASNRIFESASTSAPARLQFNGYGSVYVSSDSNTYTFRNGPSQPLELVLNYAMGEFSPAAGGAIIVSNCAITETNVAGGIVKTGDGLLYLGASNRYSGGITIQTGTVRVGHARALGTGGLTVNGGLLDLNGLDLSVPRLSGTGGNISDTTATGGVLTLTVTQTVTTTYAGLVSDGLQSQLGLAKSGTGTLWLARTNTYGGPTLAASGQLLLTSNGTGSTNGIPVGQLGTGLVTVSSGGTFGGFGRVLGSVTNNGLLRPGATTGLLAVAGNYAQATNAAVVFQIGGPTAAQFRVQTMQIAVVTTNFNGVTNVVSTNFPAVAVTGLYNRLTVDGHASLGGTLRVALTNGYTPPTGATFSVISASSFSGAFSTNSFLTNNLPSVGSNREWNVIYFSTGVVLTVRTVGPPGVYVTDATTTEGATGTTNLQFQVVLSKPATATVTIAYTTSNGTATAGSDYTAASGNVTIPVGAITGLITVAASGDSLHEADETLTVNLISATNATLVDSQAVGTLLNDDTAPGVTVGDASLVEGSSGTTPLQFQVILSTTSSLNALIDLATSNGTAVAGSDFIATNLTLTIPAGSRTGLVTVLIYGDESHEPDEAFTLHIVSASNAVIAEAVGTGSITNDDAPPSLAIANIALAEGAAGLTEFAFTVVLSAPSAFPVSFAFATSNGTASAGSDYLSTNATVQVLPGDGSTTLTVQVSGDLDFEGSEEFHVLLSNPSNATILVAMATGTILDDDAPPASGFDLYVQQIGDLGQRGYQDDPDGDGYVNLLEYATGGDPTIADALAAMSAVWTNGMLALRFNRNTNGIDVTLFVDRAHSAADDASWLGIATNVAGSWGGNTNVTESGIGSPVDVLAEDPGVSTNKFLRLRVTRP